MSGPPPSPPPPVPPPAEPPLAQALARRIRAAGPLTVAEYMADCLLHPEHGYYATRDPFGAAGDFTTAPEISQMFGELAGLCLAQAWIDRGAPAPFTLAELGPGRGTLMADMLRATARVPGFHAAARIHLVEASPVLRARQRQALAGHAVTWADSAADLPEDAPLFLVANEFFDALPIRQFQRDPEGWRERMVALVPDGPADPGEPAAGAPDLSGGARRLGFVLSAAGPIPALTRRLADTAPGEMVEICPPAGPVMAAIADRIAARGGLALIVDYGGWHSRGDTLQALERHGPVDPLARPGEADLTAHVDFEALAAAAPGLRASALTPQGVWLERLGITARAQALAARLQGPAHAAHVAAHRRLTHPDEMGTLFKVMALTDPAAPLPPGVDP